MDQAKQNSAFQKLPLKWGIVLVVGLLVIGWLFNTPTGILGKADAVGYAVCHRIDVRSFHIHDRPLPLCARCTGMYLGAMLGIIFQAVVGRRRSGLPSIAVWVTLGVMVMVFAIDGLNSYMHLSVMQQMLPQIPRLYEPNNTLRLITGTMMGLAIAIALVPVFNQTIWNEIDQRPILNNLKFVILLVLAVPLDLLVLTEIPWVLYPLAIISALGVLVILTMVYSMVIVMLTKRDNLYANIYQLGLPLVAGFGVALLQIAVLDIMRYWMVGSWAGFSL